MNRYLFSFAVAAAAVAACPGSSRSDGDSDQATLRAELNELMGEIESTTEDGPSIAALVEGRVPDVVVLVSSEVRGEVAPCG